MIVSSFIIQANVIMIVNYDHKTFIVQATDRSDIRMKKFLNEGTGRSDLDPENSVFGGSEDRHRSERIKIR
jgi:hypothetical protein